jgi:hypothetical protein
MLINFFSFESREGPEVVLWGKCVIQRTHGFCAVTVEAKTDCIYKGIKKSYSFFN